LLNSSKNDDDDAVAYTNCSQSSQWTGWAKKPDLFEHW